MWKKVIYEDSLVESVHKKKIELEGELRKKNLNYQRLSLLDDFGGIILTHAYLYKLQNDSLNISTLDLYLKKYLKNITNTSSLLYSNGLSGALFILNHLQNSDIIEYDIDVDTSIFNHMISNSNIDFLHGSSGIIYYLLSKDCVASRQMVFNWTESLTNFSEIDNEKITWKTKYNSDEDAFGHCLGLAHGSPSIIILLTKIAEKYNSNKVKKILIKAVNGLLFFQNSKEENSYFPYSINIKNQKHQGKRLGWCYGDLGCAMALYKAGKSLNNQKYISLGEEIFIHHTKNLEEAAKLIIDPDFCHGSVGIAHMYARMYNYTNNELFRATSEYWYRATLEKAFHKDGLAGFKHYNGATQSYSNETGLLEGVSGILLSFISAISDVEPKWDSAFLLS